MFDYTGKHLNLFPSTHREESREMKHKKIKSIEDFEVYQKAVRLDAESSSA
jgi:hypothetical protein